MSKKPDFVAHIPLDTDRQIAHTPNDQGSPHWLDEHLRSVGKWATEFASHFGAGELAECLGLWHDLGKYNPKFQAYLKAQEQGQQHEKVPHAIWGAALAYLLLWKRDKNSEDWKEIALPIAGHHAGLDNGGELSLKLEKFLKENSDFVKHLPQNFPKPQNKALQGFHPYLINSTKRELFIRMAFSALVDADYLDTEKHFNQGKADQRGQWASIKTLWQRFEVNQTLLLASAQQSTSDDVRLVRRQVYDACCQKAKNSPGAVYRLRVPTGGGKTRSSLAFALQHILRNLDSLHRIIVAIPYTSIIDQNVQEYRKILDKKYHQVLNPDLNQIILENGRFLGDDAVLEHHSQYEPVADENQNPAVLQSRFATENWDAPLIVTTTVQLFESLFANRTSRVRKLHNIAQSVIILDEVQTLPPELLKPTLDVLRCLVEAYGVTLVLCTATQPTFEESRYLKPFKGIEIKEIVEDYSEHFEKLRRVTYQHESQPLTWALLAQNVKSLLADTIALPQQALIILNTRRNALSVLDEFKNIGNEGDGVYHLSTLLCGAHRRKILAEIRKRLHEKQPCIVVSTQVVEAGVDLDFPLVYRAIAPLDRIVQAAGRCNREGKLKDATDTLIKGKVIVFEPDPAEASEPRGPYKAGIMAARNILKNIDPAELHNPELYRKYFQEFFALVNQEKGEEVQAERQRLNYPRVADLYRLIANDTVPVVVHYGDSEKRLQAWMHTRTQKTWRRLQPYLVNLYHYEVIRLKKESDWLLESVSDNLYRWRGDYDNQRGIMAAMPDPADLIV